jgi:uncharacterized protein
VRLAVISDTHLSAPTPWFEAVYAKYLAPADRLFHCGDSTGLAMWSFLLQHPRFEAVAGNSDASDLAASLPAILERSIAGRRLAVVHGWGPRPGLSGRIAEALGDRADLIFFGHSHAFEDTTSGKTRLINPGSLRPGGSLALVETGPDAWTVRRISV